MKTIAERIPTHRRLILVFFLVLTLVSAYAASHVVVNNNMADYLPADAPSTEALRVMGEEFPITLPNARVAYPVSSVGEALILKSNIEALPGVTQVLWLDDVIDVQKPLEQADPKTVQTYYQNGMALFQVTADDINAQESVAALRGVAPDGVLTGEIVELANAQKSVQSEVYSIVLKVVPIVFMILLLSTKSFLDPVLFLVTIGVSVLLNMGSNLILGEVSFITQAVSGVLQLAVSMDYAIFLLNRYNANRLEGMTNEEAMVSAVRTSSTAISSSAATTFFGFLALLFMQFRLGADLGIVMAKGIVCSFITVLFFLPALILTCQKPLDRLSHRPLLPDFEIFGRLAYKGRLVFLLLALVVAVPSFLASQRNKFIYGMGNYPEGSVVAHDEAVITEHFGEMQQLVLMVPRGDLVKEQKLQVDLEEIPTIDAVVSYVSMADAAIPQEIAATNEGMKQLVSENYSQFILSAAMPTEGDVAFETVRQVDEAAGRYYDSFHLTGYPAVTDDMRKTVQQDNSIVNGLAILTIALTILLAFRSLSLPILLVLTIEIAIWLNLSVPYFSGNSLSYIGYLIISTVQLGATVDYAILYSQHYLDLRERLGRRDAVVEASRQTVPSLLPPALILTSAGTVLSLTSSIAIVSELGTVLARGALLSLGMVVFVLPGLLALCDRFIQKTTRGLHFQSKESSPIHDPKEANA
ncbi:MAG: MMPL family transporter [Peptoniphilaceae bacterium]|nr:MMPL family transporter [Peptoniphilaceae bacterium]MDY6085416.1 MMPL family transporter [Peptoniphilaceae bacterium]